MPLRNRTKVGIFTEYIRCHDLDIFFLQEIKDPELLAMPGYDIYYNIGSDMRGTAIVARIDIAIMNTNKLPSGRAIADECKGLYIVNIYRPSETAKRTEHEYLYNAEVPELLQSGLGEIIIGGDLNCVLDSADTSGNFHTSRALTEMIRGLHLGATKRPPRLKIDPSMLCDDELLNQLRQQWSRWQTHKSLYPNVNISWDRFVQHGLQRYLRAWGAERRRDFRVMEEHLYTCIYGIEKRDTSPDKKLPVLNGYRAKLVRLQARGTECLRLDTSEGDIIDTEETTLYYSIKSTKRREARMIRRAQDQRGRITDDPTEIAHIFVAHLKDKYSPIDVSESCVAEMLYAI